jgi:RNA polymerase sigma-70 factor, ECF subfamily
VPKAPSRDSVTRLLIDWTSGDQQARDRLLELVYQHLHRLAGVYMRRERQDHTLQPTALVHEAYMRLIDQRQVDWRNRAQFLAVAAVLMRRILVNHARDRIAAKRGGGAHRVSLAVAEEALPMMARVDVMALHEALDRLAELDPRKSQIVELKFFGGLTTKEIAEHLDLSLATIEREWAFSRAARRRLGGLLGGERGRELIGQADDAMTARAVREPPAHDADAGTRFP